jgi:hypothetical protein
VLSRRQRGALARLADVLGIPPAKLANALAGRERLPPAAEGALLRWIADYTDIGHMPPYDPTATEALA